MAQPTNLTPQYVAQLVLRVLNERNIKRDSSFGEREVIAHVRDACHFLIKGEWFRIRNEGGKHIGSHYIATYNSITVTNDITRGRNKATLPAEYMALPKDMGIRAVFTQTGTPANDEAMIPLPSEYALIYSSLPAEALEQKWGYEVERDTLWFTENGGQTLLTAGISNVRIQMVTVSPNLVGDTDALPIPPELRWDLVNLVLERLGVKEQIVRDDVSDESPESVR